MLWVDMRLPGRCGVGVVGGYEAAWEVWCGCCVGGYAVSYLLQVSALSCQNAGSHLQKPSLQAALSSRH